MLGSVQIIGWFVPQQPPNHLALGLLDLLFQAIRGMEQKVSPARKQGLTVRPEDCARDSSSNKRDYPARAEPIL